MRRTHRVLRPIALVLAFASAAGSMGCEREEKLPPPIVWAEEGAPEAAADAPASEATIRQVVAPAPERSTETASNAERNNRWAEEKRLEDQRQKLEEEKKALEDEKKKLDEEKTKLDEEKKKLDEDKKLAADEMTKLEGAKKELEQERQRLDEERRRLEEQRQQQVPQQPAPCEAQPKVDPVTPPAA